jgi:hypothetical protein
MTINHEITLQRDNGYRGRNVAKPTSATLRGLRRPTGSELEITLKFDTFAWEDWESHRIDVVPVAAMVTLHAAAQRNASLGWCYACPDHILSPCKNDHHGEVKFAVSLTMPQIEELETLRSGGEFLLEMNVAVHVLITGDTSSFEATTVWAPSRPIPDKEWTQALRDMGFIDHVWIDVPLPKGGGPGGAADRLRDAQAERTRGRSDVAVSACRLAIEAVKQGGFGARVPQEVHKFIMDNARSLTKRERVAVVRAAVELLLHPAHHADSKPDDFSRKDATASVALVASVISLIEELGPDPKSS